MIKRFWLLACLLCLLIISTPSLAQEGDSLIGPDIYPIGINPLTGLPVDNPEVLNQRPLIVKIVNAPAEVRPQHGLMAADIVWEHLLAGGITRFSAIYYSQTPNYVGPVRSMRLVDFELIRVYHALLTASGGSDGTIRILFQDPYAYQHTFYQGGPCPMMCRSGETDIPYEWTLYANPQALRQSTEAFRDTTPEGVSGMAFHEATPLGGRYIYYAYVRYRQTPVYWEWEPVERVWLRSQDGLEHYDEATGERVRAANVLIIEDDHIEQPYVAENYWGPSNYAFSVNLVGSGRIILLRDGQMFEGEWRRPSREAPLQFYDLQGNVLPFKPGNTFVNLVPRWNRGYSLEFGLVNPLTATVMVQSANIRQGPSANYPSGRAATLGQEFMVIGRNNRGDWLQIRYDDELTLWIAASLVEVNGDIMSLPVVVPTVDG